MKNKITYYLCVIFLISLISGCVQIDSNSNPISQSPVDEIVTDEDLEKDSKAQRFSNKQIESVFYNGINDFLWYHPDYLERNPKAFPPMDKELFYLVLTAPEDIAANRTSNAVMLLSEEETDQAAFFRVYDIFENTGGIDIEITAFNGYTLDEIIEAFPDYDQNIHGKITIPNKPATIPDYGSFEGKEKVVNVCKKAIIDRYLEYDQIDNQHIRYELFIKNFYSYDRYITALLIEKDGDVVYILDVSRAYDAYEINQTVFTKQEIQDSAFLMIWFQRLKEMSIDQSSFTT